MAVYEFNQGKFERVAEAIDELLKGRAIRWEGVDELMAQLRFMPHDDVPNVYVSYRRRQADGSSTKLADWKRDVCWVFEVTVAEDGIDFVLVKDSLPDYLALLAALEPLVQRRKDLVAEVAAAREGSR